MSWMAALTGGSKEGGGGTSVDVKSSGKAGGVGGNVIINPQSLNLGEILNPYNQGSPENGGKIETLHSRYMDYFTKPMSGEITAQTRDYFPYAVSGVVLIVLAIGIKYLRRG